MNSTESVKQNQKEFSADDLVAINADLTDSLLAFVEIIDDMPDEVRMVSLEIMKHMRSRLWEIVGYVEARIVESMLKDDTKKISYRDSEGKSKEAMIKAKTPKCTRKDEEAMAIYESNGFDRHDIGDDVFLVSWAKAKKAMDYSGDKKRVIESLFKSEGFTLAVKEVAK
jgi:hypothetical protein